MPIYGYLEKCSYIQKNFSKSTNRLMSNNMLIHNKISQRYIDQRQQQQQHAKAVTMAQQSIQEWQQLLQIEPGAQQGQHIVQGS